MDLVPLTAQHHVLCSLEMILRGGTPRREPVWNPAPPAETEGSDPKHMKHLEKITKGESKGQDQGPHLPYCGVHIAPHIINQAVNNCNRQQPLNNPEAQKTQTKHTQITDSITSLKPIFC